MSDVSWTMGQSWMFCSCEEKLFQEKTRIIRGKHFCVNPNFGHGPNVDDSYNTSAMQKKKEI
jgi:hypothetical protein